jgi:hypothetical protein
LPDLVELAAQQRPARWIALGVRSLRIDHDDAEIAEARHEDTGEVAAALHRRPVHERNQPSPARTQSS